MGERNPIRGNKIEATSLREVFLEKDKILRTRGPIAFRLLSGTITNKRKTCRRKKMMKFGLNFHSDYKLKFATEAAEILPKLFLYSLRLKQQPFLVEDGFFFNPKYTL
jgi:hypothetical protein